MTKCEAKSPAATTGVNIGTNLRMCNSTQLIAGVMHNQFFTEKQPLGCRTEPSTPRAVCPKQKSRRPRRNNKARQPESVNSNVSESSDKLDAIPGIQNNLNDRRCKSGSIASASEKSTLEESKKVAFPSFRDALSNVNDSGTTERTVSKYKSFAAPVWMRSPDPKDVPFPCRFDSLTSDNAGDSSAMRRSESVIC